MKATNVIQENGQITLPAEWRDKYHLKTGDEITFVETDNGLVIVPSQVLMNAALDDIGEALQGDGVTLEELIESGREIRGELLKELYGIDASDAD
jgi:AbrB family looped-hinge helix DNA binding protein